MEKELLPHVDALHGYALYLTRKRTDAEELTQETLLKAVKSFAQYQLGTNCKAWLFRIMYNTFLNNVRGRRIQIEFEEGHMSDLSGVEDVRGFAKANKTPEESFVNMLSRSKVRDAVETLPPDFRAVVVLADLEELSYKEIAEALSCPIGTVMSRLHRGRKLLRMRLMSYAREMGLLAPTAEADDSERQEEKSMDEEKITHLAAYRSGPGARTEKMED